MLWYASMYVFDPLHQHQHPTMPDHVMFLPPPQCPYCWSPGESMVVVVMPLLLQLQQLLLL